MNLLKPLSMLLLIAAMVFGSLQLATVPMPNPEMLCGAWG
jgi:hypothetical protein